MMSGSKYRVFISHSHVDPEIAARIKSELSDYGISAFVAHDDIVPTTEWLNEIDRVLGECEVLVAILTLKFKESLWCDQEVGIAYAHKKLIIPLKAGLDPYGFIGKYQGLKWKGDTYKDLQESLHALCVLLTQKGMINMDRLIDAFVNAGSFDDANYRARLLEAQGPFTKEQIDRMVTGATINRQVYQANRSWPFFTDLREKQGDLVEKTKWDALFKILS